MEQSRTHIFWQQGIMYLAVSIFAIFIGSQITEGAILVPYWKSLSAEQFYGYYQEFGPSIGQFYTILTIVAALIPLAFSIYSKAINSSAFKYALISTFFALLCIGCFYVYFKGTNELFYQAALDDMALKNELINWNYWHWSRVFIECLSLLFLIFAMIKLRNADGN